MDGNPAAPPSNDDDVGPLWAMMVVQTNDDGDSSLAVLHGNESGDGDLNITSDDMNIVWEEDDNEDEVITHLTSPTETETLMTRRPVLSKEDLSFLDKNTMAVERGISPEKEEDDVPLKVNNMLVVKASMGDGITSSVPSLAYPLGHLQMPSPPLKASSCSHLPPFSCAEPRTPHAEYSTGMGKALLSETLEQVKKSLEEVSPVFEDKTQDVNAKKLQKVYWKNLIVLSCSIMLVYSPFYALRNLQSSINHVDGLGLMSMATMGVTFIVGCILAPGLVIRIRPKNGILIGLSGFLVYIFANFHATFYTLLPATLILGFTTSSLWIAQGTYLTSIAVSCAAISKKRHDQVLAMFNGTAIFFLQFSQFLGNLISSTTLQLGMESHSESLSVGPLADEYLLPTDVPPFKNVSFSISRRSASWNSSICGAAYCHAYKIDHRGYEISRDTFFILLGLFSALCVFGMVIPCFLLDKLDVIFHKRKTTAWEQLLGVGRLHKRKEMLLVIPFYLFLGAQGAFVYGDVTKAFITCPLGIHKVGYVMMMFGLCDSIMAFFNGLFQRCCGRRCVIFSVGVFHLAVMVILSLWKPTSNEQIFVYLVLGALGICDATWQTQASTTCGLLFKEKEFAFAAFRLYESLGFTIAAAVAQFICIDVKVIVLSVLLVVSMLSSALLEHFTVPTEGMIPPAEV